eukprot:4275537-Prymnesium_polylepis.2
MHAHQPLPCAFDPASGSHSCGRLHEVPGRPMVAVARLFDEPKALHPANVQRCAHLAGKLLLGPDHAPVEVVRQLALWRLRFLVALEAHHRRREAVAVVVSAQEPADPQLGPPRAQVIQDGLIRMQCVDVEPVEGDVREPRRRI